MVTIGSNGADAATPSRCGRSLIDRVTIESRVPVLRHYNGICHVYVDRDADAEALRMRRETDDYVDAKLANFEVALHKTISAVQKGRDKIRGRHDFDGLGEPYDDTPLPG